MRPDATGERDRQSWDLDGPKLTVRERCSSPCLILDSRLTPFFLLGFIGKAAPALRHRYPICA
jgi:hypothetical protein